MTYAYSFPRMQVTVDIIVTYRHYFLAIERKNEPFNGQFALPGGFVEMGERLVTAAKRELLEETGLKIAEDELSFVGVYDDIKRDPRDRTISALYYCRFGYKPRAKADDDAASVKWISIYDVVDGKVKLAFDHDEMIRHCFNLYFVNR